MEEKNQLSQERIKEFKHLIIIKIKGKEG